MSARLGLRIASYNIHKAVGLDGIRDPERIITVLRELRADVIALQEADLRFGSRAAVLPRVLLDDTPWQVVPVAKRPRSMGWHGNAILARRDIEIDHAEPLDLPTLEPRGAVRADLRLGKARFRLVGMHLDLSGLRRRDQIRAILKHCEACGDGIPTVMLGDFNQWGRARGAMTEFGRHWRDLGIAASFPSRRPLAALDRIVVSRHWDSDGADVHHSALAAQASDHLPVCADLRLGG